MSRNQGAGFDGIDFCSMATMGSGAGFEQEVKKEFARKREAFKRRCEKVVGSEVVGSEVVGSEVYYI